MKYSRDSSAKLAAALSERRNAGFFRFELATFLVSLWLRLRCPSGGPHSSPTSLTRENFCLQWPASGLLRLLDVCGVMSEQVSRLFLDSYSARIISHENRFTLYVWCSYSDRDNGHLVNQETSLKSEILRLINFDV